MKPFLDLVILTLRDPARGLAAVNARGLTMSDRWAMLLLSAALSAVLSWVAVRILGTTGQGFSTLALHPITLASLQVLAAAALAILLYRVGRAFGGRGGFPASLLAIGWLELVMLAVQVPQLAIALVAPELAGLVGFLTFFLYIYLAIEFTRAIHGFASRVMVFLGMAGTLFATGVMLSILAAILGITPEIVP